MSPVAKAINVVSLTNGIGRDLNAAEMRTACRQAAEKALEEVGSDLGEIDDAELVKEVNARLSAGTIADEDIEVDRSCGCDNAGTGGGHG